MMESADVSASDATLLVMLFLSSIALSSVSAIASNYSQATTAVNESLRVT